MQRAGTAVGHQREIAGIEPPFGSDALHRIRHGGGRDPQDAFRRRRDIHSERPCHALAQSAFGGGDVEPHLAAEKSFRPQAAEQKIGIRHRRLAAAEAIAGGTGGGARALRTNPQRPLLDPRNRAAAGTYLENVHHRDLDRQRLVVAPDQGGTGRERLPVVDDAGLGGRSAHVEGNRIPASKRAAKRLRPDHAGCRSRFQHVHAVFPGLLGFVEAPCRLHDQE